MAINGFLNGHHWRLIPRRDDDIAWNPLEHTGPPVEFVPAVWDAVHCGKRLVEGLRTLMLLPMPRGPQAFTSAWPEYAHDWSDQLAQAEMDRDQREKVERAKNKTRLRPSSIEIAHMEQSIRWPLMYVRELPQLVRTVQAVAVAHARERNMEDAARKLQLPGRLVRRWNEEGLALIARGLIRERIRIW
jgi:hypothetical protein